MPAIIAVLAATAIPITVLTSGYKSTTLYISLTKVPQHDGMIQEVVFPFTDVYPYIFGSYLCFFSPDTLWISGQ